MKYVVRTLTIITILALAGCGTAKGVLQGTGSVLEGVATDVRSAGNWF